MNAKKMLVVYLNSTQAVVGVATRRATGAPPIEDLVGAALPLRAAGKDSGVAIVAAELGVKEVDYGDAVIRLPLNHGLDSGGAVILVAPTITITNTVTKVTLTLSTPVAAGKPAIVVIDAGANREPLKFTVRTAAGSSVEVPVTGVPSGSREIFASVEGYASRFMPGTF